MDTGSVGGGASAGAKGSTGGGTGATAGASFDMKASHANTTKSDYGTQQSTMSTDVNNWKQSDLYNKDSTFRSMVDATETAQHRYSDSMAKSQAIQEQLQTAQQTAVSQSVNTNDGAWQRALDNNNGNTQAALQEYNSVAGRQQHFADQKQETLGQTGVDSHLGVTSQAQNNFENNFDIKFDNKAHAAGNNVEAHVKENLGKGAGVVTQSEQGLSDAHEMTKGSKISTADHSNADKANGLPDAAQAAGNKLSDVQDNATKLGQNVKPSDSGYPTTTKDKEE